LVHGKVVTVFMVGKQHEYVWQGFCYYELRWSPIWELIAADVIIISTLSHIA